MATSAPSESTDPELQETAWDLEPLVEGEGAVLRDSRGREYIDGNSSIWTNIHGHRHPKITEEALSDALVAFTLP